MALGDGELGPTYVQLQHLALIPAQLPRPPRSPVAQRERAVTDGRNGELGAAGRHVRRGGHHHKGGGQLLLHIGLVRRDEHIGVAAAEGFCACATDVLFAAARLFVGLEAGKAGGGRLAAIGGRSAAAVVAKGCRRGQLLVRAAALELGMVRKGRTFVLRILQADSCGTTF
jgi:hypothetical protein